MALRDYILCKNCKCKLIPDGYDLVRDHLEEKWGDPEAYYYTPMLLCPDCVAALERDVEALALRTKKAIGAIAASHQGILDNCRAGQSVDSGERATIGRPCPNLGGGRGTNNRDCKHGQLGRTCPLCELEEELDEKAKTASAQQRVLNGLAEMLGVEAGDVDGLITRGERVRKDAERYRWLRKGESDDVAVVRGLGATDYGGGAVVYTFSEELDGDDLDAAIDAAMKKEGKQ